MDQLVPVLFPLRRVAHPKGDVMHGMKVSDPGFAGFGEAYFTTIIAGETKGWKKHTAMVMNLLVPCGEVAFFVHEPASGVTTRFTVGSGNYARLCVPPGYWVAFRGLADGLNLVCNLASMEHDPLEAENAALDAFPLEAAP